MRDAVEENSFSTVSSPAPGGPLSPLMGDNMDDLQDVPINDSSNDTPINKHLQSQSLEEVFQKFSNDYYHIYIYFFKLLEL